MVQIQTWCHWLNCVPFKGELTALVFGPSATALLVNKVMAGIISYVSYMDYAVSEI